MEDIATVSPVFRALAAHPNYLITAWTALKPNAQTAFFEHQADALRRAAVEGVAPFGRPPVGDESRSALIRALHYIEPKVFLATVALRTATNGALPTMQYLLPEEKRQIAPGPVQEMAEVTYADPDSFDERSAAVVREIVETTGQRTLGAEYRALASNPDTLEHAWAALRPAVAQPQYRALQRSLRLRAESAVATLPFRMDIAPHVLRQSGLSESEIDAVRQTLADLLTGAAATVINVSLLATGTLGPEEALASPFPPPLL